MDYYLADAAGRQIGPLPREQLMANGLRPESMVWTAGMGQWQPASAVADLAPLFTASTAPPFVAPPQAAWPQNPGGQQGYSQPPFAGQGFGQSGFAQQPGYAQSGYPQPNFSQPGFTQPGFGPSSLGDVSSKKLAAGLCGILLGGLGIHKFILGMPGPGVITILLSIITLGIAGHIIGLIEGIIYLTKSDSEFYYTYMVQKKQWF